MLTNPTLVVEVMSPSSKNYDSGLKGEFYRSLGSLQAYLLIDQEDVYTQLYTRHEEGWLLREYRGLEATIPLEAIGCTLPLSDVYEGAS
jgi:Uma2 family endonuclease